MQMDKTRTWTERACEALYPRWKVQAIVDAQMSADGVKRQSVALDGRTLDDLKPLDVWLARRSLMQRS